MKTITFSQALEKLRTDYGKIWSIKFEYHEADKSLSKPTDITVWNPNDKHCFYDTDLIQDFLNLGFLEIIQYNIMNDRIELVIFKQYHLT